ncbi:ROK family protein [Embleya sp. NPDC059259]|uniref:ROK family transcriptional regulator n=1 Tax=unclassified Embleya TaxID=2699296 RepID=UPI003693C97A
MTTARAATTAPSATALRTATPSTARAINDRLALDLLIEHGPLTASQLKTLTGLSRPTVADLVERLGGAGLIHLVGEAGERQRGPNARLYGIVAERAHIAGLDVRVGGVELAVADLAGRTVATGALAIPADRDPARALADILGLLDAAAARAGADTLHTFGIGVPGLVDPASGNLRSSCFPPGWHAPLVAALRERGRVLLENESNLACIAEQRLGAARNLDTFVLVWLGQGIGAGVMLDGRLRRGASGGSGELGFLPVPGTGHRPSRVDCSGGFHTLVSGLAIEELAAGHGFTGSAEECVRAAAEQVDAGQDTGAGAALLDELAARVVVGAAALAVILDPGCVVLGGETGRAGGTALADRVEARLAEATPLSTRVLAGSVPGNAILDGAVLTALDDARDELFGGRQR